MRLTAFFAVTVVLLGCRSEPLPGRALPKDAFARLAPCVDKADAACLFAELDRDSRWSVQSVHRTLLEIKSLVEKSYPDEPGLRGSAYGAYAREAQTTSPAQLFAEYCRKRGCLKSISDHFGAVQEVKSTGEHTAVVKTTRGGEYPMARAEQEWGLALYQKEFQDAKIRLADALDQVRRNAQAYDEQRLAGGAQEPLKE